MSKLSLITVTYRSAAAMPSFLAAARRAAPGAEIVVIDNASDDDTIQVVKQCDPAVKVIRCSQNVGFARGCNRGALEAGAEWLLFLNPDLHLRRVALPPSNRMYEAGLWSGLNAFDDGAMPRSQLRADTSVAEDYVTQLVARLLPPAISSRLPSRRTPPGWAAGALLLTQRETFRRVGGFDPRYFLYFEDRDLGTEYRRRGLCIRDLPTLAGAHQRGRSSTGVSSADRDGWSLLSWLEYLAKWRGQRTAMRAAVTIFSTFQAIARFGDSRAGTLRARRKGLHGAEVLRHMERFEDLLPAGSDGFYPLARRAIAAAKARPAAR